MHYYVLKKALLDFHYFFLIFSIRKRLKKIFFGNLIDIYLLHKYSDINKVKYNNKDWLG